MPIGMRVTWKRNIVGNLLAICVLATLIISYVKLLQYNKASSTTFSLVSNRHRVIRGVALHGYSHLEREQGKDRSKVNVHVVEEHHQVIPIWINAARSGMIKQHGNVLVHIDGHSDMGAPYYIPGYPFFRMPKDSKETIMMVQRNDAFIAEMIMAGVIKRIIWIWPSWDKVNHQKVYNYVYGEIGWGHIRTGESLKEKVFCICVRNNTSNTKECSYLSLPHEGIDGSGIENKMKPSACNIKKSFVMEEVREDEVVRKLNSKKWLRKEDKVILDIDLDYYGCMHVSQPLIDVGLTITSLDMMNHVLMKLFCPKSSKEEQETDRILVKVLSLFIKPSTCSSKINGKQVLAKKQKCKKDGHKKEALDLLKNFLWNQGNKVACQKRSRENENLLTQLIDLFFSHLKSKQIAVLKKIGFCLNTMLNSYLPLTNPVFSVCMGSNTPIDSAVYIHKPTKNETIKRTSILQRILSFLKEMTPPQLITVCRSVRDGYTPRFLFELIDRGVMKSINSCFSPTKIHYDSWLLGGKYGWPNRHQRR